MENKNLKRLVPVELRDDELDNVSGGTFGDLVICPECGKKMREGYICTQCDMADGRALCYRCGGEVTREHACSCGLTWEAYCRDTQWLRE